MILFLILFLLISQSRAYSDDNNKDNDDNNEIDENRCAVMFEGARCENVKRGLPECVNGAFEGSWISLNQKSLKHDEADDDDKWKVLEDISEVNAKALPEYDVFKTDGKNPGRSVVKTCAVVSSSSQLIGKKLGRDIDANEVVFRFNNAPTDGYEEDVGSKTSVRFTNAIFQGFRERASDTVLAKWCTGPTSRSSGKHHHALGPRRPPMKCGFTDELLSLNEKKVHALNPLFFDYVVQSPYFKKLHEHPSSGIVTAIMLLHKCEKVSLYGFSFGNRMKDWYYPKRTTNSAPEKSAWLREKHWVVEDNWSYAIANESRLRRSSRALLHGNTTTITTTNEEQQQQQTKRTIKVKEDQAIAHHRNHRKLLHDIGAERKCVHALELARFIFLKG